MLQAEAKNSKQTKNNKSTTELLLQWEEAGEIRTESFFF